MGDLVSSSAYIRVLANRSMGAEHRLQTEGFTPLTIAHSSCVFIPQPGESPSLKRVKEG